MVSPDLLMFQGRTFITGIASSYDETYDEERLGLYLTEKEWTYLIKHLNDTIHNFWPCNASIWFGYIFSIITCGASFLIPNLCIREAKESLLSAIERQNRLKLKEKGLMMTYNSGFTTSWISIDIIEPKSPQEQEKHV